MPAVQQRQYASQPQPIVGTSLLRFPSFVEPYGANGLRNVIDSIEVEVALSAVTVADAAVEGEDIWRLISQLWVREVDGFERYQGIKGDALRNLCYEALGAARVPEYADIAIGAAQALTYRFPVPLAKRYYKRPNDFSMPAELLREVAVGGPDTSDEGIGVGSATVSALAGTIRLIANVHEEDAAEVKMRDQVAVLDFPALTGLTLSPTGKLHGLMFYARGASGGASLASSFTSVQIAPRIVPEITVKDDLIHGYLQTRGAHANLASTDGTMVHNDPVAAGRAIPVVYTTEDTSTFDGETLEREQFVKTLMSQTGMLAIVRTVAPESDQIVAKVARAAKASPAELRAKTLSKGRNGRANLARHPFITKSLPLNVRGLQR